MWQWTGILHGKCSKCKPKKKCKKLVYSWKCQWYLNKIFELHMKFKDRHAPITRGSHSLLQETLVQSAVLSQRKWLNTFLLCVIKRSHWKSVRVVVWQGSHRTHYLITRLLTLSAPPPFDSASFTFAHSVALSSVFHLIITLRETSRLTRWHSQFHCLSKWGDQRLLLPEVLGRGHPTRPDARTESIRPGLQLDWAEV